MGAKGGEDGDKKSNGGVGEEKASGKEGGGVEGDALEPRPECGESTKEEARGNGAPGELHRERECLLRWGLANPCMKKACGAGGKLT